MTTIEQALYDYLSPRAQKEVDDYFALEDEAIDLMVREPKVEPDEDGTNAERLARDAYCEKDVDEDDLRDEARFARDTEPQDNIPSGAVKSER